MFDHHYRLCINKSKRLLNCQLTESVVNFNANIMKANVIYERRNQFTHTYTEKLIIIIMISQFRHYSVTVFV